MPLVSRQRPRPPATASPGGDIRRRIIRLVARRRACEGNPPLLQWEMVYR
jgi:hypothetical protein